MPTVIAMMLFFQSLNVSCHRSTLNGATAADLIACFAVFNSMVGVFFTFGRTFIA
jgi:hypothetical protein